MLGIELAHDLPVAIDQRFHAIAFPHPRVVVQRPSVERAQLTSALARHVLEEAACPLPITAIGSRANEGQFVAISRHPRAVPAKFCRIGLRSKVAAASPSLVANPPVAN